MKHSTLIIAPALALTLAGCAMNPLTGRNYTPGQVRSIQSVEYGTILRITSARINPKNSGRILSQQSIGPGVGAAVGGLLGSTLGGGNGKLLLALAGAIGGGLAGQGIQQKVETRPGVVLTIRTGPVASTTHSPNRQKFKSGFWGNSGGSAAQAPATVLAIAQEIDSSSPRFTVGERVEILQGNGVARVIPAPEGVGK